MQNLSMETKSSQMVDIIAQKHRMRLKEQRKFLPYLVHDYLLHNCCELAPTFFNQMRLNNDIVLVENYALEKILDEYVSSVFSKTSTVPKLCQKAGAIRNVTDNVQRQAQSNGSNGNDVEIDQECTRLANAMTVMSIFGNNSDNVTPEYQSPFENLRKLQHSKSISDLYPCNKELQHMANDIAMEIVVNNLNVQWEDIIGYEKCKTDLWNAVFLPFWYPQLYNKKFTPCSSILLYGPPGTGKTMLAKAVATAAECTFFNITSSSIVSKWRGDSEKYIRVLFDLATYWAPSIIFIDEIDWVTSCDSRDCSSSSDPAKRFRAEFLGRFDGLLTQNYKNVCVLAATNLPWTMDAALLRRFEKKILVNLPDERTRQKIFRYYVNPEINESIIKQFAEKSENYSCADIKLVCKEARMNEILFGFKFYSVLGLKKPTQERVKIPANYPDTITDPKIVLDILTNAKPKNLKVGEKYTMWAEN